ncbi:MAG: DUF934 domain-containing protein [Methyloligellaceae bacterium]
MPLIKDNEFVENIWQRLEDTDAAPETGAVIVSYDRLKEEADLLKAQNLKLGVIIPSDIEAELLEPFLGKLDLIVLQFPTFANGRAYSQARTIREHLGYEGELRATGDVLPDQAVLMMRCGFDTFEVAENVSLDIWKKCVAILNTNYQRSYAVAGDEVRVE